MAKGLLSIPFRLTPNGTVATTPYGSDTSVNEAIAALTLTVIGERPMQPEFGVPDPAFGGISVGDIQVGLDQFGPEDVTVESVTMEPQSNTTSTARISWQRSGD